MLEAWTGPQGARVGLGQCGMREEPTADFLNHEHVCSAAYTLIRIRKEQFDTGFEPNVDVHHGTGDIINVQ